MRRLPLIGQQQTKTIGEAIFVSAGVPTDKILDCIEWAFGKVKETDPIILLLERWNSRHGDMWKIKNIKELAGDIKYMEKTLYYIAKAYNWDVLGKGKKFHET